MEQISGVFKLEEKTYNSFIKLKKYLNITYGINIVMDSAYRSLEEQQNIMDDFIKKYGEEYAKSTVAPVGASEHHTGLAFDVVIEKDGKLINENEVMLKETELFGEIHKSLAQFGLILRYPEGKKDITGYNYEPWHFRYIDNIKVAKKIMENGYAYEEYYEMQKCGCHQKLR